MHITAQHSRFSLVEDMLESEKVSIVIIIIMIIYLFMPESFCFFFVFRA